MFFVLTAYFFNNLTFLRLRFILQFIIQKKLPKALGLGEFSIETNLTYFFTIKNSDLLFLAYSALEQGLQFILGSDSP
jgi:hypothetical protein